MSSPLLAGLYTLILDPAPRHNVHTILILVVDFCATIYRGQSLPCVHSVICLLFSSHLHSEIKSLLLAVDVRRSPHTVCAAS